jgi:hypothetical protein
MRRGSSDYSGRTDRDEDRERRFPCGGAASRLNCGKVKMTADYIRTKFRNFPAANLLAKIVSR